MIGAALACLLSLGTITEDKSPSYSDRYWARNGDSLRICVRVYQTAQARGIDPLELLAVGFVETRHRDLISPAGAVGPLQALPRYWCPRRGACDPVEAGARAWAHYRARAESLEEAAGGYNGAGPRSGYARAVRAHHDLLRARVEALPVWVRWGAYGR